MGISCVVIWRVIWVKDWKRSGEIKQGDTADHFSPIINLKERSMLHDLYYLQLFVPFSNAQKRPGTSGGYVFRRDYKYILKVKD